MFRENIIKSTFLKWQKDLKDRTSGQGPLSRDPILTSDVTNWPAQGPDVDCRKVLLGLYNVLKMLEFVCQVIWSPTSY